jgi:glycosyltransferase involved in cell wall biosynthesis
LKRYAENDSRIKIIDTENEGQGKARNRAMEHAVGEYIGFVDSDDWIDKDMFRLLYESVKKYDSEIAICEFAHYDSTTGHITQPTWLRLSVDKKYDNKAFCWSDITQSIFRINSGPWNKIYKRDYIIQHHIEFANGVYYQDVLFVYKSLINARAISIVRKPLYFYRHSRKGSTSSDKGKKQFDIFYVLNLLQEGIQAKFNDADLKKSFFLYKFDQYLFHLREVDQKYKREFWIKIITEFKCLDQDIRKTLMTNNPRLKAGIKHGLCYYNKIWVYFLLQKLISKIFSIGNIKKMFRKEIH